MKIKARMGQFKIINPMNRPIKKIQHESDYFNQAQVQKGPIYGQDILFEIGFDP